MTRTSAQALILFAKDPVAGQVKTRLSSLLDNSTTLNLYHHFLSDSIEKVCSVAEADRFIGIASNSQTGYFEDVSRRRSVQLFVQEGDNLGERMRRAFEERFKEGYERVVIIGADSPTLPTAYIEQALQSKKEVVIGPSTDGGYYLIGMQGKVTDVFEGVSWGTDQVLSETLDVLKGQRAEAELLPVWYDVDLPEDLRFLKTHLEWMVHSGLQENKATLEFLNQLHLESKI
ncbi:MAG: TIGR04282 family arsenosugar biosynthesis glycosyltransferase [Nitrospinota bacterium]|nr:TIGR04282 family arsenosugar biosynthesis glycosyltransferase [Nitrospinota bacterium]